MAAIDIEAGLVGVLVPLESSWTAAVWRYEKAWNLLHPAGNMISLVRDDRDMGPFSIFAPDLFLKSRASPPASSEEQASYRAATGILTLAGTELALQGVPSWNGSLPPELRAAWSTLDPAEMIESIEPSLLRHGSPDGLLGLLGGEKSPFARAAMKMEWPDLAGFGPGLTPSGDDFLAGVLLCDELEPGRAIRVRLESTTAAGRTLLAGALQGQFPAYLLRFAARAARGPEAVEAAVLEAVGHGASSGTDALVGFALRLMYYFRSYEKTVGP